MRQHQVVTHRSLYPLSFILFFSACSQSADSPATDAVAATDMMIDVSIDAPPDMSAVDSAQDMAASPDIDWASLPTLPPDKTFTTRYAAGAASMNINPPDPVGRHLGGFGFCMFSPDDCKYSIGLHDDLWATAAAVADTQTGELVVFVGLDALGMFRCDVDRIHEAAPMAFYERFGIRVHGPRVVVASSHSHGGPDSAGLYGPMLGAERDEEAYIAQLRDAILQVALDAVADLGDATLDRAVGAAPNTHDDLHADDEEIHALRARRPDGAAVFHLVRWNAHPTVTGFDNDAITADWVGAFRKRLEAEAGGTVVYVNGPIGSVYADGVDGCEEPDAFPEGVQDPDVDPAHYGEVACVGYRVADHTLSALEDAVPVPETGLVFRHAEFGFHPTNLTMTVLLEASPIPIEGPEDIHDPDSLMFTHLSWITLGDLDLVTAPGEAFPHFAAHAKERLAAGGATTPVVIGLGQDWLGYLMSAEQYDEEHLGYFRGLSPGELIEAAYLDALQALIDAEN